MYCERDNPMKRLEGNDMRIEDLKAGEFYNWCGHKVELLAIRNSRAILYRVKDGYIERIETVSTINPWKEGVVLDRWLNIYPHSKGICSHESVKSAADVAKYSGDFIETLHVRYDSSLPLKDRIKVICDE